MPAWGWRVRGFGLGGFPEAAVVVAFGGDPSGPVLGSGAVRRGILRERSASQSGSAGCGAIGVGPVGVINVGNSSALPGKVT